MRADKKKRTETVRGVAVKQTGSSPVLYTSNGVGRSDSISSQGSASIYGSTKIFSIAPPEKLMRCIPLDQCNSLESQTSNLANYTATAHTSRHVPPSDYNPAIYYESEADSRNAYISRQSVPLDPALTESKPQFVPQGLPQDPEHQSVCFFMTKFVQTSRQEEIWGGCLEVLPALYNDVNSQSALSSATTATAMGSIAWNPGYAQYKQVSLSKYVASLKMINDAVQDPKKSKSDNVLMAVLMLGFYEVQFHSKACSTFAD